MKKYFFAKGENSPFAVTVRQGGETLPLYPRTDLWSFGNGQFAWGKPSPCTYQLAMALIADATGHEGLALELAVEYGDSVVSQWKGSTFSHSEEDITRWVIQRLCAMAFIYDPEQSVDLATCHIGGNDER